MQFCNKKVKNIALLLIAIIILSATMSGCIDGELDVSRLMEKPLEYSVPRVKSAEEDKWGADPEVMPEYEGYYIDVNPAYGDKLRITNVEILPQLIMEAYKDSTNVIDLDFKEKFRNTLRIFNSYDEMVLEVDVTSDGTAFARLDKNSPIFRLPEYPYYAIEACLWNMGDPETEMTTTTACSLIDPLFDWAPSMGTGSIELRLEHDIKTLLYQMYGYSEAVFVNYKIYSTKTSDRQYKLYMLLSYEGYEFVDDKFWPRFREIIPVQVVYSWVEGDFWFISDLEFADYITDSHKFKKEDIRKILPYLDTQTAIEDLEDTYKFEKELQRQALEYLARNGYDDIERDERK